MNELLWNAVHTAAVDKNPKEMIRILYHSNFLDGLERRMRHKWTDITPEDLDNMIIAAAVDDLYRSISNGKQVHNPGGYIFKAANNRALMFIKQQKQMLEGLKHSSKGVHDFEDPYQEKPESFDYDYCLQRSLQEARRLLPRLGKENVQKVMSYVFDCIEARVYNVTPASIAESVGISARTVSVQLKRGFERLERIAMEEALGDRIIEEAKLITDIDDDSEVEDDEHSN